MASLEKIVSLAPQKISAGALKDMLELFEAQPWLLRLHEEMTHLWDLCESRDEQILLKTLLSGFFMLDARRELEACEAISEKVQESGLSPKTTWIVAVANKDEIDGSTAGLQKLKNKLEPYEQWHSRLVANIPAAAGKVKNGDVVLLFDDFIGTGEKMVNKKNWLVKLLSAEGVDDVKFSYFSFSGMRFGIENIEDATDAQVFSHHILLKGITETFPLEQAEAMIALMLQLESRLGLTYKHKKLEEFSLGYKKSESLYCGQNDNCPNNVFPVLWWPNLKSGKVFKTVLKRAG